MSDVVIFCGYTETKIGPKPTGAYTVASVFREIGLTVTVVDKTFNLSEDILESSIQKFVSNNTKFICVSNTLLDWSQPRISSLLARCKKNAPDAVSIIGGSYVIKGNRFPGFDYGVIGQAESTVPVIISHVLFNTPLIIEEEVNGTKYISDKTYKYDIYNNSTGLIYTKDDMITPGEALAVEFGRGCVFKCGYCQYDLIGKKFGDLTKSEDVMYSIFMDNYEKFGTTRYVLSDDTINDSLDKALLLERVVNKLPFKFEFSGYMRVELFKKHPEMMEIYKNCGILGAKFGIETLNKQAGLTVGKGLGMQAKDLIEKLYSYWGEDVILNLNFIVGLPYDTVKDLEEQCRWLEDSPAVFAAAMNPLSLYKSNDKDPLMSKGYYRYHEIQNAESSMIRWVSDIMDVDKCKELAKEYHNRVMSKKTTMWRHIDVFEVPCILQDYTKEELQLKSVSWSAGDVAAFNRGINKLRTSRYVSLLKSTQDPGYTDSASWNIKPIHPVFNLKKE
jgi:radical SAM superfamily enzyme YgiQ (UPF0313 family)